MHERNQPRCVRNYRSDQADRKAATSLAVSVEPKQTLFLEGTTVTTHLEGFRNSPDRTFVKKFRDRYAASEYVYDLAGW
jgi:hypothetical protein